MLQNDQYPSTLYNHPQDLQQHGLPCTHQHGSEPEDGYCAEVTLLIECQLTQRSFSDEPHTLSTCSLPTRSISLRSVSVPFLGETPTSGQSSSAHTLEVPVLLSIFVLQETSNFQENVASRVIQKKRLTNSKEKIYVILIRLF